MPKISTAIATARMHAKHAATVTKHRTADWIAHKRLLSHYRQFIAKGDCVFDVGANVGNRTAAFRELGATVIAVEPQERCFQELHRKFGADPLVTVVPVALAAEAGTATIWVNDKDIISSMSREWIEATEQASRFTQSRWVGEQTTATTTLDNLIQYYGVPAFCKIDVEGYELEVLSGLTQPLKTVSYEFTQETIHRAVECADRLAELGPVEFSLHHGEAVRLDGWRGREAIRRDLVSLPDPLAWGDVYARFV